MSLGTGLTVLKKLDLDQKLSESLVKVVSGDPPTNSKMSLDE
nr:hypothetical protein [Saccharolobus solfataricus]